MRGSPAISAHVRPPGRSSSTGSDSLHEAVREAVLAGEAEAARLQEIVTSALQLMGGLVADLASGDDSPASASSQAFADLSQSAMHHLTDHFARQRGVLRTFNIALFGRTGAGKSSLVSAFAELDGSRVSRGESDWTVDVEPVPWQNCLLYDTPGINGWGRTRSREDLEAAARRAVEVADVVLLCFDTQSQQAIEFKKVADWVQDYGKTVIALLNSRNLMWRHPARAPEAARPHLSKSVREHAGNIRDELAAIGLAGTPVVAVQAQRALDARAAQPYAGPDATNHALRRRDFGLDYLYKWSNLPALEELVAATVQTGGSRLRLRGLREGVRTTLRGLAEGLELAAGGARASLDVCERTVEAALAVLGYPERENRGLLRAGKARHDVLSELEDLRDAPFRAPTVGRLESHVAHLISSQFAALRAQSLKQASTCVRAAFDERKKLSDENFRREVFIDAKIRAATSHVWEMAGAFLQRELDLNWEEAASDLSSDTDRVEVEGRAGSTGRFVGGAIHASGLVAGSVSGVLAVIAGTQFWNPAGWVAALLVVGTGLLSSVLGWLGKKTREKAERQRLAARSEALGLVRLAVEDVYRDIEDAILREVCAAAWKLHSGSLMRILQEAISLQRAAQGSESLAREMQRLAQEVPASPAPGEVLQGASGRVLERRPPGTKPDDVWLGEDWIRDPTDRAGPVAEGASERLRWLAEQDQSRLSDALCAMWSSPPTSEIESWVRGLADAVKDLPVLAEICDRAQARLAAEPAVALIGDYSAGKSSLIKRLLVEAGHRPPDDLEVRADPTTSSVRAYEWRHVRLLDTPGLQSGRAGHDATAVASADGAALIILVLQVNLMLGDMTALSGILAGTSTTSAAASRTLFVINRCDELGVDPPGDPEEFVRRRARKENELREILSAQGFAFAPLIHTVAGDPYGLVGDRKDVGPSDYGEQFRTWDGIGALTGALASTASVTARLLLHAAFAEAEGGLRRLQEDLAKQLDSATQGRVASAALLQELENAIENGLLLASSLEHNLGLIVRARAERAVADALGASTADLDRATRAAAAWWLSPALFADAASYWTRAQRDLDHWRNTTSSAVRRSDPGLWTNPLESVRPTGKLPKSKRRGAGRRAAAATMGGGNLAKAMGHRDIVYKIGKAIGHKWKPWGAVKGAAKLSRVGAVLGVVAVGFDAVSWISDRSAEGQGEGYRVALADFIEESVNQVTTRLTRGTEPDGPLTVMDAALADFRSAARDLADVLATRDTATGALKCELEEVERQLQAIPRSRIPKEDAE